MLLPSSKGWILFQTQSVGHLGFHYRSRHDQVGPGSVSALRLVRHPCLYMERHQDFRQGKHYYVEVFEVSSFTLIVKRAFPSRTKNVFFSALTKLLIHKIWGAVDSQSRKPGFESSCCRFEAWAISFMPRCHSSLN